jgi:hydroxyacylglutathione hydrolase
MEQGNTPLVYLNDEKAELSNDKINYVHCAGGYCSMIAYSILKARGFNNIINIESGMGEF